MALVYTVKLGTFLPETVRMTTNFDEVTKYLRACAKWSKDHKRPVRVYYEVA